MPVSHAFVSHVPDLVEHPELVRPTNWNAGHIVSVDLSSEVTGSLSSAQISLQVSTQSGTTYELQKSDYGTVIRFTSSSSVTVTCPGTLDVGFNVGIIQIGTGQITVSPGSGATVANVDSQLKTYGQNAACALIVDSNSDSLSAHWIFGGRTAA